MSMSAQLRSLPAIGERWFSTNGRHEGAPIRITDVRGRSVVFRQDGNGGANMGGSKYDPSRDQALPLDKFYGLYARTDPAAGSPGTIAPYRRVATPKEKPAEDAKPVVVKTGVIVTGSGDPNVEFVDISPAMGKTWIDRTVKHGKQRKVRPRKVAQYLAAMRTGRNERWKQTEPITLDKYGNVANGQHRLLALIASGLTIRFMVVRGVDDDAINAMDTGATRSSGDVLGMHGFPNVTALSAAVRGVVYMERYGTIIPTLREAAWLLDNGSILEYAEQHKDELLHALFLAGRIHDAGFGGTGAWTVMLTWFSRIDPAMTETFADAIVSGTNLTAGHPALVLRNRIAQAPKGTFGNMHGRLMLAAMTIKAWNAYRSGKTIEVLAYRPEGKKPEAFPVAK